MTSLRFTLCLALLLPASCASDSGKPKTEERRSLSQRLDEGNGYKQDQKGNWVPQNDKRSSFESQGEAPNFSGKVAKTQYKTNDLSKRSWWGNKDYAPQQYAGTTDGSRFQKTSKFGSKGASEAKKNAGLSNTYQTGDYSTGTARETGSNSNESTSQPYSRARDKADFTPEIIDWREQRSLSLEQSKGILGR